MIACVDVDRGILMTFGSGAYGCLGHGNSNDVSQVYLLSVCLSAVTVGTGSLPSGRQVAVRLPLLSVLVFCR